MKRTISILLTILLLLTSCGKTSINKPTGAENVNKTEEPQNTETEAETESEFLDSLPERDFGGATYQILAAVEQWENKHHAEELNGEQLTDSIYKRDKRTEERFNVDMVSEVVNGYSAGMSTVTTKLKGSIQAGDGAYDLFVGNSVYVSSNVVAGLYQNLIPMEYLTLDSPWYYTNCNAAMTINNQMYTCAGYYGISTIAETNGIIFNKQMCTKLGMDYPYQTVLEGKWTYDRMLEMANKASQDADGNGKMDGNDIYGFLSTNYETIRFLTYGLGYKATENDSDGIPYLLGATERNVNVADMLTDLMNDTRLLYCAETDPEAEVIPMFVGGKGLFVVYSLNIIERDSIRDGDDFGIIPLPKYDETQSIYTNGLFPEIQAIPTVVKNAEMSQIVLEALNAASCKDVVPAYYEVILQRKLTRDNDSSAMIDLILNGAISDLSLIFYFELDNRLCSIWQFIQDTSYATFWAGNEKSIKKKLEKILNFYGITG